ncbi:MAG: flagellar hook-length control protein FliK [bacterium]
MRPGRDSHGLPHSVPVSLVRAATRASRGDKVEIVLDPAELGKVRFELTTVNDRVQVNLSVERGETLDLLRRNADSLRAEFRDAGFDGSSLNFSHWNQRSPDSKPPTTPADDATFDMPDAATPAPLRLNSTGKGLDLRL